MRNALVLLYCPWEHVQAMGYLTFVLCACNGLENKEVTGSIEEQVEANDSEEEVEADDSKGRWWRLMTVKANDSEDEVEADDSEEEVEANDSEEEVEVDDSEDYNLTDSTEQEVKYMGYECDDTLNCRTYV